MRHALPLAALLALSLLPVSAQAQSAHDGHSHATGTICTLHATPNDGTASIPPPADLIDKLEARRSLSKSAAATIQIQYVTTAEDANCAAWPIAAQAAMQYAADLWEGYLESAPVATITACWNTALSGNTLGSAGAFRLRGNFTGAPIVNTWYPDALANALGGSDIDPATPEMLARFAAARTDWYFGTDANPAPNEIDFVTVALHELGHALGFSGSANGANPNGTILLSGFYTAFDRLSEDGGGVRLTDTGTYPDNGANLGSILRGGTVGGNQLVFTRNGADLRQLYTPNTWNQGSSYSHFDQTIAGELMRPFVSAGVAIHDPGSALGVFDALGWPGSLPVELVAFDAVADGRSVALAWSTASETNNEGFTVEHRAPGREAFSQAAFVGGAGTTLEAQSYALRLPNLVPGTHTFRLVQRDLDGALETSPVIEVLIGFEGDVWLSSPAPNPSLGRTTLTLRVSTDRQVRVDAFDVLGRHVATVHDGPARADEAVSVSFNTQSLAPGTYLLRVTAGQSVFTQPVVVARR